MPDHPQDDLLRQRLQRAATDLSKAADAYERQRNSPVFAHPNGRPTFGGRWIRVAAVAATGLVALGVVGLLRSPNKGPQATVVQVAGEGTTSSSIGPASSVEATSITSTAPSREAIELGSRSHPVEIVFPVGEVSARISVSWGLTTGTATTAELGPMHGVGTFRAQAGQKLRLAAPTASPTTVLVTTIDSNTTDNEVASFSLPGTGSAVLPVTGRYQIEFQPPANADPYMVEFSIR